MSADVDTFTRAMSLAVHELRTPATVVAGYLRILLREQAGPLSDKQRKMLEEADRSCARLVAIVSEMSDLAKLESGGAQMAQADFDLVRLVEELASGMHEGTDRGIGLEVRGTDQPLLVRGDRVRIGAVLTALMRLAVRERAEPGVIVVECSTAPRDGRSWAIVAIGDDAVTKSLAEAASPSPAAFDEWRGGLGLALPIARRVVEAHGGAIWSASGGRSGGASALRLPLTSD